MLLIIHVLEGKDGKDQEPRKAFPVLKNITFNKLTLKITV